MDDLGEKFISVASGVIISILGVGLTLLIITHDSASNIT